ncbi:MAG: hypothetical protein QOI91_2839 [Solirubrobacteraceae bacterium]|jgi:AcrR family transcriptional regulator|nr:hypothetical protein [Solirubrobacteraceae bacterium]
MAVSPSSAEVRRIRERDLVRATRALFDERGMQDAPIEEIAKSVGIARGLIYRQFSSKEELYVLTVTEYLDELAALMRDAVGDERDPRRRLECLMEAYASYCERYPAFLDCCTSLMRRSARDLHEIVSDSVWLRLGQGMAGCLDQVAQALRAGSEAGIFDVEDPDYMASVLWTQAMGTMHLARVRVGVRQAGPGIPEMFKVTPEQIVRTCVDSALAAIEPGRRR